MEGETKIDVAPISKPLAKVEPGVFRHPDGKRLLFQPDEDFEMRMCCGQVTTCDKDLMHFLAKCCVSFVIGTREFSAPRSKVSVVPHRPAGVERRLTLRPEQIECWLYDAELSHGLANP